jgi:biopolymer transport protein ExbD
MAISSNQVPAISAINMTPLIDVMLVLLVIFIITLPHLTHAIKIDNPVPNPTPFRPRAVVDVAIDFDGRLSWNQRPVDRLELQAYIAQAAAKLPQPEIHISVDKFARYEIVAQTLADLQSRGLKSIGFVNRDP